MEEDEHRKRSGRKKGKGEKKKMKAKDRKQRSGKEARMKKQKKKSNIGSKETHEEKLKKLKRVEGEEILMQCIEKKGCEREKKLQVKKIRYV